MTETLIYRPTPQSQPISIPYTRDRIIDPRVSLDYSVDVFTGQYNGHTITEIGFDKFALQIARAVRASEDKTKRAN